MRLAKDENTGTEVMVTQFDMVALEALGYVKFDILTLRTLDTLQECINLIQAKYSMQVNPYDWTGEYEDPQVWDEVSEGRTLGLFQIETASGTRLTKRMQPHSIDDLAAVMTVVRPGPMRSGLTESYLRRRAGLEPVTYPDPRLAEILGDTYGAAIYQEQVMSICMNLAGYDSTEADNVRKLLGKKQVEKVQAAGEEFVRRAVEHDTARDVADLLWSQMAEFAKYGFNRAHAFGYAVLGYWCAFLRFHYPVEFLVAALSTVDADRIPEFVEDCRNSGYGVVPPHINRSQVQFSADGMDVIYGLSQVKGIGEPTAAQIVAQREHDGLYTSMEDFDARNFFSGSKVDRGNLATLVRVGAFDDLVPNRRAVERRLEMVASGEAKRCVHKTDLPNPAHPHNLPCGFDWSAEVDPPMIRKRNPETKKMESVPKPPQKTCNISCRQYQAPDLDHLTGDTEPYSPQEIMQRERELLGTWVTYSPFHFVPKDVLENPQYSTARQIEAGPAGTEWYGIAMVEAVKKRKDKNGGDYAFVRLNIQDGEIEPICFASMFTEFGQHIRPDRVAGVAIRKTPRGYQLTDFVPVN
jgi:DNA polymerase-3 subunit alpha